MQQGTIELGGWLFKGATFCFISAGVYFLVLSIERMKHLEWQSRDRKALTVGETDGRTTV